MEQTGQPTYIAIARIARPRGNRGEVLADLYTDFPDRFGSLSEVSVEYPGGRLEVRSIEQFWFHKNRLVLKLGGSDSISDAEKLAGAWVLVPCGDAIELPENTYFDHDLIGCTVTTVNGVELGPIAEVMKLDGNTLFAIRSRHGEILIPAAGSYFREISIRERRILVDLPEGLVDLNR